MAIVQISQITQRKGLQIDLPQLAGAEFGWSTDTRQLYIGNGTLADGAPVIGNTEILTEFSDILNLAASYTYKGTAAGYVVQTGPTPGDPVVLSLQNWMDQFASVKDFGATGDGVTDDTDAINRALYQLFCRQANPQIRRSLFFPAGVYKTSGTINIPPYATLIGEGSRNSIIQLIDASGETYVAQTADSLQQTGVNIGNNNATPPVGITLNGLALQTLDATNNIMLVQSATDCKFTNVGFYGPGTTTTLIVDTAETTGVAFGSQGLLITSNITFEDCNYGGTVYGVYCDQQVEGINIDNSSFDILYQGVALGIGTIVATGPTGVRITNNLFDNIYAEGIIFGDVNLNATGYNIFYDVADSFDGITNPSASCILIQGDNNVSIGDMFARSDVYSTNFPRVNIGSTVTIATTNGNQLALGGLTMDSGLTATLTGGATTATLFTFDTAYQEANSFKLTYSITRANAFRTGTLWVVSTGTSLLNYMDDYVENTDCGIDLTVSQAGTEITVEYTATAGSNSQMGYQLSYQN